MHILEDKMSDTYFNLVFVNNEKAVYAEKGKIIINGLFDDYHKEVELNFSETAVYSSVIISAVIVDNTLELTYLAGENFEEVAEIILL